ncbi:transmembrane protein, putative (macronuclear) [Tetrahymena thermophila SB210]|uniref:Transmembrane protein, putative n=1 Tax=Tetrahymena thermophila (strain SB210) TaxID=312017 RepID=W7XG39_TETTS|nr:transmembrane protein, putative [Tetrahymena thermophila SB210]EWS71789.1 transmembrane protein, putative [Tetrahymena thermophila SB210]|eukprot:XP_012655676.1 transmembrane protein, putative [Tetrahymena thermophila SB210]
MQQQKSYPRLLQLEIKILNQIKYNFARLPNYCLVFILSRVVFQFTNSISYKRNLYLEGDQMCVKIQIITLIMSKKFQLYLFSLIYFNYKRNCSQKVQTSRSLYLFQLIFLGCTNFILIKLPAIWYEENCKIKVKHVRAPFFLQIQVKTYQKQKQQIKVNQYNLTLNFNQHISIQMYVRVCMINKQQNAQLKFYYQLIIFIHQISLLILSFFFHSQISIPCLSVIFMNLIWQFLQLVSELINELINELYIIQCNQQIIGNIFCQVTYDNFNIYFY